MALPAAAVPAGLALPPNTPITARLKRGATPAQDRLVLPVPFERAAVAPLVVLAATLIPVLALARLTWLGPALGVPAWAWALLIGVLLALLTGVFTGARAHRAAVVADATGIRCGGRTAPWPARPDDIAVVERLLANEARGGTDLVVTAIVAGRDGRPLEVARERSADRAGAAAADVARSTALARAQRLWSFAAERGFVPGAAARPAASG